MNTTTTMLHRPAIIVHGGASSTPEGLHQVAMNGCTRAAEIGWALLSRRRSALEAVEAAVRELEDEPTFDAGRGSVLNAAGEIELDAIIMDGRDLNLGAVIAVKHLRHPVTLARLIMTESKHNILVADGAELFAREQGLPLVPNWHLLVERERERWLSGDPVEEASDVVRCGLSAGTVGAVALDRKGHLAAATSTGGTFHKYPGRVGDSPLVGCGAYADDHTGAVSATGEGEDLMKIVISKLTCDSIAGGLTAHEAAEEAIRVLAERTGGQGGLIVLDRHGDMGVAHNTPYLAHAYIGREGDVHADIGA